MMIEMKKEKEIGEEGRGDGCLGVTGQVEEASALCWAGRRPGLQRREGGVLELVLVVVDLENFGGDGGGIEWRRW